MMTLRKKLLLIIGSILLALVFIVVLVIVMNRKPTVPADVVAPENELGIISEPVSDAVIPKIEEEMNIKIAPVAPVVSEDASERYVRQLAKIFVERIGTYSNQNDNAHISDVVSMTTQRMQEYLVSQGIERSSRYSGVTTRAISAEVQSFGEGVAVVGVGVQQEVRNAGENSQTIYKNGRVNLVEEGGEWKVSGLYWD